MTTAEENFRNLEQGKKEELLDLNDRIQAHTGPWGEELGGEENADKSIQMPYYAWDPLIHEFVEFMYKNNLMVGFNWGSWEQGREWFRSEDQNKYKNLNIETALKLLTAVIRNDRFVEGALVHAFKTGELPKIINRLPELSKSNKLNPEKR